jgi:hypothetical protein
MREKRIITVTVFARNLKGVIMDFEKMLEGVMKYGKKATRLGWNSGETLWSNGHLLVHNTPYWKGEEKNEHIDGYPYVTQCEDVTAKDWRFVHEPNSNEMGAES